MALPDHIVLRAHEYTLGDIREVELPISTEYQFTLNLNGRPYVAIACSGADLSCLAVGHLLSDGVIASSSDISDIRIDEENLLIDVVTADTDAVVERLMAVKTIASGCGQPTGAITVPAAGNEAMPRLRADEVLACMKEFLRSSALHTLTHGVHSAALNRFSGERIAFFDEIGRHNAIDKALGYALLNGIPLYDKMITTTGRLASEIVQKIIAASVPVIVSRAVPTSRSVELARRYNVIMIGRIRTGGFHIFHGWENIIC